MNTPLHVLIVEDEPLISWSLAETLSECGDRVTKAASGAAALHVLSNASEPFDVVLLDYRLPDVSNLGLLSILRRFWPSTRVILMSAYATREVAAHALALGASCVVSKPIDMHDVPALVHRTGAPLN